MPASLVNVSSAMSVKLQTGTSGTGNATYSSFSFSRINGTKTADEFAAFVAGGVPLFAVPLAEVRITNNIAICNIFLKWYRCIF